MSAAAIIDRAHALQETAQSLGLSCPNGDAQTLKRSLLAQSLRRAAFTAAPCTSQNLRALVFAALMPLADNPETLKAEIDDTLQDLIVAGDILEMRTDFGGRRDIVLRPAPPSFVVRQDGSFIIIGVSGDEITPTHEPPVTYHASGLRSLLTADIESCRVELLNLGLIELSERLWLHAPMATPAADCVANWRSRLPEDRKPEKIGELEILDMASPTSFYKGRWTGLRANHAGIFIARRPQRYGARLWSLVDVKDGLVQRFTDIRAKDSRTRDCDVAWQLQAAMDAVAGTSQKVRVSANGAKTTFSFQSPLPIWAARRLSFIGEQVFIPRALIAFEIPTENSDEELRWLGENLWLVRDEERGAA